MKNYTLYSEQVTEQHQVKCYLIDLPRVITEFALHYGIAITDVKITA